MKRGTGWRKDKPDARDRSYSAHRLAGVVAPPPEGHAGQYVLDVLDQGQLGSCVANSLAQNVRMSHVRQGAKNPPLLARLMLYYHARAYSHDQANDTGTYTRNACAALVKFGFAPESVWPYDDNTTPEPDGTPAKFAQMPPWQAFQQAFDQRAQQTAAGTLPAYLKILETGTARIPIIQHAIASGFGVSFGTPVSEAFCKGQLDPTQPLAPPIGQQIAGGHELLLTDYVTQNGVVVFRGPNSWGTGWGDKGWWCPSVEYITWSETDDLAIVEMPPLYATENA